MTQLDGDIRHWIGYLGIGYSWNRYAVQFSAVAQRIKIQYPQWVAYAAYQVVMENGGGADNYADALVYFKRNHGDIDQLTTSAIKTFLVDWGVAPFTDYGV